MVVLEISKNHGGYHYNPYAVTVFILLLSVPYVQFLKSLIPAYELIKRELHHLYNSHVLPGRLVGNECSWRFTGYGSHI